MFTLFIYYYFFLMLALAYYKCMMSRPAIHAYLRITTMILIDFRNNDFITLLGLGVTRELRAAPGHWPSRDKQYLRLQTIFLHTIIDFTYLSRVR